MPESKIQKNEDKFSITIIACLNLNLVKIQTYNILCIKSKSPLGRDRKIHEVISGQNYNIAISILVRNYNIIIYINFEFKNKFYISLCQLSRWFKLTWRNNNNNSSQRKHVKILNIQKQNSVFLILNNLHFGANSKF